MFSVQYTCRDVIDKVQTEKRVINITNPVEASCIPSVSLDLPAFKTSLLTEINLILRLSPLSFSFKLDRYLRQPTTTTISSNTPAPPPTGAAMTTTFPPLSTSSP